MYLVHVDAALYGRGGHMPRLRIKLIYIAAVALTLVTG